MEVKSAELVENSVGCQGEVLDVLTVQEAEVSDALVQLLQGMDVLVVQTRVFTLQQREGTTFNQSL